MFESHLPLSIVDLTIGPSVHSFSVGLPQLELSQVSVVIWVFFEALALSEIVIPDSFVGSTTPIFHDAHPISLLTHRVRLSEEYSVWELLDLHTFHLFQLCKICLCRHIALNHDPIHYKSIIGVEKPLNVEV